MNIVRTSGIALSIVSIIALSGCQGMYRSTRFRAAASGEIHVNEPPYRAVCDVDRTRARAELLKQYEVETFRAVAQKVSHEISKDDILDLRRLEPSTGARAD